MRFGYKQDRFSLQVLWYAGPVPVRDPVFETAPNADEIQGHSQVEFSLLGSVRLLQTKHLGIDVIGGLARGEISTDRVGCSDSYSWWETKPERCEQSPPETPLQVTRFYPKAGLSLQKEITSGIGISLSIFYSGSRFRWSDRPQTGPSISVAVGFGFFPR